MSDNYERLRALKDEILADQWAAEPLVKAAKVVVDNMADEAAIDPEIGYVIVLTVAEGNALRAAIAAGKFQW